MKKILILSFLFVFCISASAINSTPVENYLTENLVINSDFNTNQDNFDIEIDFLKCYYRICQYHQNGTVTCSEWREIPCNSVIETKVQ